MIILTKFVFIISITIKMFVQAQLMSGEVLSFDFGDVLQYNVKKLRLVLSQQLRKLPSRIVISRNDGGEFTTIDDNEVLVENQKYMVFVN